jgi:hypothetical protein
MVAVGIIATPNIHLLSFRKEFIFYFHLLSHINSHINKTTVLKRWQRGSCKTTTYFSVLLPFAFSLCGSKAVSVSAYLLLALKPTK